MRTCLSLLLLVVSGMPMLGDVVKFNVIGVNSELVAGADCVCFTLPDSVFYKVGVTDKSGYFEMEEPEGDWYINIGSVGFEPYRITKSQYWSNKNSVRNPDGSTLPMVLQMVPKASELNELVVSATKGDFKMKDGIITYTNLDEIMKTRVISSAHELLKALPLIVSQDGNSISLTGAPTGSVIYINGKQSNMDMGMLLEYLKSIPPQNVKDIEIIYTPTPKWKTRSSVINVVLKRQAAYTFNGQLRATGGWRDAFSGQGGASAFVGLPNTNVNAGYTYSSSKTKTKSEFLARHTIDSQITEVLNTDESTSRSKSHNVFANVDYDINKTNTLTFNYNGQFTPQSRYNLNSINSLYGNYDYSSETDNSFNAFSMSYANKSGISAGVDYSHYLTHRGQLISSLVLPERAALTGTSSQTVDRVKGYLDFQTPVGGGWTLLYGGSYEFNSNRNRMQNVSDDSSMEGSDIRSTTDDETADIYLGWMKSFFNNRLQTSVSLKGEYYKMEDYRQTQLLPTVNLTYYPNSTHIFQASYRSYRQYPSMWQRQDYKSYTSPYQISEGNPALKPCTNHLATLNYFWRQKYVVSLIYNRVNNFFLSQPYQPADKTVIIDQPYNIDHTSVGELGVSVPFNFGNRFFLNYAASATYARFKSNDWHGLTFDKSKFGAKLILNNTWVMTQKPRTSLFVAGVYMSPGITGLWDNGNCYLLISGITGSFFKDCLVVNLSGSDLLQRAVSKQTLRFGNQWMESNTNFYQRYISLSLTYNFKGYKQKDAKDYDTSRYGIK